MSSSNPQAQPIDEKEVLCLLALCYSNREIAAQLNIAPETVAQLKAEAMKKFGLRGRVDIIKYAQQQGWLG